MDGLWSPWFCGTGGGQGQASREWFASALDTLRVLGQNVDPQAYKNQMQGAQTDPGVVVMSQGCQLCAYTCHCPGGAGV